MERLTALPQVTGHNTAATPQQREVSSLSTWTCAFAKYKAVLAQARLDLITSHLAYLCNIVPEASTTPVMRGAKYNVARSA